MTRQSDIFMLVLLIAIIGTWLYFRFKRWLHAPSRVKLPFPEAAPFARTEAVRLLEEAGYEVISGKMRIPIIVELDEEPLDTRLFVDYFARKEHELYAVKLSKARMPVQWTASGIRDRLMLYSSLFEETHGILYIDQEENRIRKIKFDVGDPE